MIRRIVRLIGFCIFVAAFFLPAVKPAGSAPGTSGQVGWQCAAWAILPTWTILHGHIEGITTDSMQLILSGWINPLLLVYLLLCIWPRLVWVRRALAAVILAAFAATWFFFSSQALTPMIGHYLWVAGALIVLGPEVVILVKKSESTESQPLSQ